MAMATKTAMATEMRVLGDKEGNSGKAMAMTTRVTGEQMATATKRAMAMVPKEVGKKEDGSNGGKQWRWQWQQRGQWQGRQQW
jgi:hypothetical protein